MNVPRTLTTVLAALAAIGFVLLAPIALLGFNLGRVLFNPDQLLQIVDEYVLVEQDDAALLSATVDGALTTQPDSPAAMLAGFVTENPAVMEALAPRPLLLEASRQLINNYMLWLDSPEDTVDLTFDLTPFKAQLQTNADQLAANLLNEFPACSLAQNATWATLLLGGVLGEDVSLADAPQCIPIGMQAEGMVGAAAELVTSQLGTLPDTLTLNDVGDAELLASLKTRLTVARFVMTWTWPVALVLLVASFLLGGRTWRERLPWAGWPLLAAAVLTVLLAALYPQLIFQTAQPYLNAAPTFLSAPATAFVNGIAAESRQPLLMQTVLMGLVGIALLIAAWILGVREVDMRAQKMT